MMDFNAKRNNLRRYLDVEDGLYLNPMNLGNVLPEAQANLSRVIVGSLF